MTWIADVCGTSKVDVTQSHVSCFRLSVSAHSDEAPSSRRQLEHRTCWHSKTLGVLAALICRPQTREAVIDHARHLNSSFLRPPASFLRYPENREITKSISNSGCFDDLYIAVVRETTDSSRAEVKMLGSRRHRPPPKQVCHVVIGSSPIHHHSSQVEAVWPVALRSAVLVASRKRSHQACRTSFRLAIVALGCRGMLYAFAAESSNARCYPKLHSHADLPVLHYGHIACYSVHRHSPETHL
jgi:hypothetical protein